MNTVSTRIAMTSVLVGSLLTGCHSGAAEDPMEPTAVAQPMAKTAPPAAAITIDQARAAALEAMPGTVIEEEYEKERGQWLYSFEIRGEDGVVHEVDVDPNNASILKVEVEDDDKGEGKDDDEDDDDDDDDDDDN